MHRAPVPVGCEGEGEGDGGCVRVWVAVAARGCWLLARRIIFVGNLLHLHLARALHPIDRVPAD
jgi:hypothetical protein